MNATLILDPSLRPAESLLELDKHRCRPQRARKVDLALARTRQRSAVFEPEWMKLLALDVSETAGQYRVRRSDAVALALMTRDEPLRSGRSEELQTLLEKAAERTKVVVLSVDFSTDDPESVSSADVELVQAARDLDARVVAIPANAAPPSHIVSLASELDPDAVLAPTARCDEHLYVFWLLADPDGRSFFDPSFYFDCDIAIPSIVGEQLRPGELVRFCGHPADTRENRGVLLEALTDSRLPDGDPSKPIDDLIDAACLAASEMSRG